MEIKYKHLPTGKIITIGGKSGDSLLKIIGKLGDSNLLLGDIIKGSDWQEVLEKDYEILSIRYIDNGKIYTYDVNTVYPCQITRSIIKGCYINGRTRIHPSAPEWGNIYSPNYDLKGGKVTIHSVKRLSDGEVFTIGDMTTGVSYNDSRSIESFIVQYDNSIEIKQKHGITKLKYLVKAKQPLFTTEDGVNVFKGDKWWFINIDANYLLGKSDGSSRISPGNIKRFSTKEAAEEYVLMNKPCLSINDLLELDEFASNNRLQIYMSSLKELVKSKL